MTRRQLPLSLTLPSGRLAVLDPVFMEHYFRRRLARWYPGVRFSRLVIEDHSHALYKKSLAYQLTIHARGKESTYELRANIPSLDTTRESIIAFRALRAIWERSPSFRNSIPRPLGYDPRLRMLLYEAVPGIPLTSFLRRHGTVGDRWIQASASWLARFHRLRINAGRYRSFRREQTEVRYFLMNIRGLLPEIGDEMQRVCQSYLRHRRRLGNNIQGRAILIHGDYNPNNVLVDEHSRRLSVIDFGNAWHYSPMSDLANAVVQLGYVNITNLAAITRLQQHFLRAYQQQRPFARGEEALYHLFRVWWSVQTLAFTTTLPMTTRRNIQVALTRTRTTIAESLHFLQNA